MCAVLIATAASSKATEAVKAAAKMKEKFFGAIVSFMNVMLKRIRSIAENAHIFPAAN